MIEIERAIEKKEYIERGALIAFVREVRKKLPKESKDFFTRDEMLLNFQQYLELQKAADVEEVVHGEWIRMDETQALLSVEWKCSQCGQDIRVDGIFTAIGAGWKYCPNCGAKMK